MFLNLSLDIFKLSYPQIGSLVTTQLIPTSYIGPVHGVSASQGTFCGIFWISPSNDMFLSLSLDICKLFSYSQADGLMTTQ